MSPALLDAIPNAGGIRPTAASAVRIGRAIGLIGNVCRQWLACSTYLTRLNQSEWDCALRRLCGGTLRALDIELEIGGTPPQGLGPLLLVANHISWLDSFAINSVRPCRYLSKIEVRTMPIFGTIVKNGGRGIFTVRESARDLLRTKEDVTAVLRDGYRVGLFAEATSSDGRRLLDFHSGLFQAAIDTSAAIQPVAVSYHTSDGAPTTSPAFWGDMTMGQSLAQIISAPSIIAHLEFCEPIVAGKARRRELADEARARIAQKLTLEPLEQTAASSAPHHHNGQTAQRPEQFPA
ncbi:MAG: lysophospholipid acyltransferase family protein [Candidatus Binataceae bacterium]